MSSSDSFYQIKCWCKWTHVRSLLHKGADTNITPKSRSLSWTVRYQELPSHANSFIILYNPVGEWMNWAFFVWIICLFSCAQSSGVAAWQNPVFDQSKVNWSEGLCSLSWTDQTVIHLFVLVQNSLFFLLFLHCSLVRKHKEGSFDLWVVQTAEASCLFH